jgi:hypothetical protein
MSRNITNETLRELLEISELDRERMPSVRDKLDVQKIVRKM